GTIKAQVMRKDRTKVFAQNEIIEEPTPLYWQSVIDGNRGKKSNVLKDTIEDSVSKDEELLAKGINKSDRQESEQSTDTPKLETAQDYIDAIQKRISSLSVPKQKALVPKVKKAGLPVD